MFFFTKYQVHVWKCTAAYLCHISFFRCDDEKIINDVTSARSSYIACDVMPNDLCLTIYVLGML